VVVLSVLLNVWAIFAGLLTLQIIWMLLVPLLLEVILRDLSMAVHTIAPRGSMEDLAAALCPTVMTTTSLVMESDPSRALLLEGRRAWRLHISRIAEHRHLNADLGNAMLVLLIVYGTGTRSNRRTRAATLGSLVFWCKLLAKPSRLRL
jgi:hypothetical protein